MKTLFLLFLLTLTAHAQAITGKVVGVHDGDTITVLDASRVQHKIRFNGIDAPESSQAYGQASKQNLSNLVFGKTVTVETKKTDRYGRSLGFVSVDGKDVNLAQLQAGLAWFYRQYANELDADRRAAYEQAETEARKTKRGLWADPKPVAPWDYRHPDAADKESSKPAAPSSGTSSGTTSKAGTIIGNKNSMIFHGPECPDYEKVSERNRVRFKTEKEALAAGYRKARNCP